MQLLREELNKAKHSISAQAADLEKAERNAVVGVGCFSYFELSST